MNFRLPDITGVSEAQQLSQINEYLFTLVRDLNFALRDIEQGKATAEIAGVKKTAEKINNPEVLFTDLKPLIIKNADIIKSYSESISKELAGQYVAQSEFGTFAEKTNAKIEATDKNITQYYENIQRIESSFSPGDSKAVVKTTNATITTGLVDYDKDGNALYGMEVSTVTNNEKMASARFLSTGVVIYDESGNEALIITDNTITAKNIIVSSSFTVGGMRTTVSGAVITGKYVG